MNGLFITGSDTNVGKTYIACQIAAELNKSGLNVIPRKPVESGCELVNNKLYPKDANALLKASGSDISIDEVCPYQFSPAISPQIAASIANTKISLEQLSNTCINSIHHDDFLLVEGAGGFFSPICDATLNADLAKALNLPIVVVVEDRLGSVNQTLLTINAIEKYQLEITAVILNTVSTHDKDKLINNASEIKSFIHYPVYEVSHNQSIAAEFYHQIVS